MTVRRAPDFSIDDALASPQFTPRRADLGALLERLATGDEEQRERVELAVARLGRAVLGDVLARVDASTPPLRGRLVRLAGRLAADDARRAGDQPDAARDAARARFVALLDDGDAKTRRNAVLALGKLPGDLVEAALLRRFAAEERVDHRRSIADVLGRIGGAPSLAALRAVRTEDAELARVVERAVLRLDRTGSRPTEVGVIDPRRSPPTAVSVVLGCRAGLEPILADELSALGAKAAGPGRVALELAGPLEPVLRARTWLTVGFPLPTQAGPVPEAVARALTSPAARTVLSTWGERPVRWRLAWEEGGHRRALVLACARAVAAADATLVNDPTSSAWEARVRVMGESVQVELVSRGLPDTRFAWRRRDVAAASHPTIAAGLARVAGVRADDVVWDPFVGSALELVERAKLGPARALHGTDTDRSALDAARENLRAAGVGGVTLTVADATRHAIRGGVSLVITNPPMGRRVARGTSTALLEKFVAHVGEVLLPAGRFVWLSPLPRETRLWARRAGLDLVLARVVDMGGFEAEMQVWRKGA